MKNKEIIYRELLSSIRNVVNEDISLKNDLSLDELLELKKSISPINNLITAKLTEKFLMVLQNYIPSISNNKIADLLRINASINVNANGYDFKDDDIKVIAEVKANVPYDGTKYGSAQRTGIEKDISGLINGKAKEHQTSIENYYKFLVVLDYCRDEYNSNDAIINFLNNCRFRDRVVLLNENQTVDSKEKVYILMLGI